MSFKIRSGALPNPRLGRAAVLVVGVVMFYAIALSASLHAATYYVDFSGGADKNSATSKSSPWQHAPGMVGCSTVCKSTILTDGDSLIFKGGVTWTASFPWTFIGGTVDDITYTTDHTWYSGPSFSQPIFDDNHADPVSGMANSTGTKQITINDLKFVNCGTAGVANHHECLIFTNTSNITLTNSTFQTNGWISVYFLFTQAGSYSNFVFTGNDISHTSNAIWVGSAKSNTSIHNFNISGNAFHDYHDNMVGGPHGNGLHYYGVPASDSSQYLDGMTFCNNRTYGDFTSVGSYVSGVSGGAMTAVFFSESPLSGVVCNNDFSFNPVQPNMFNSLILLSSNPKNTGPSMKVAIYNNSLQNNGVNAMSSAIGIAGLAEKDSVIIKNNVASGMQYCMYVHDSLSAAAVTSDYNLWNCNAGELDYVGKFKNYIQWQALGYDLHSVLGKTLSWMEEPGNQRLSTRSPAIAAGVNLSKLGIAALSSDAAGVARPSSSAWDIGAFQFVIPPNPPNMLTTTVR